MAELAVEHRFLVSQYRAPWKIICFWEIISWNCYKVFASTPFIIGLLLSYGLYFAFLLCLDHSFLNAGILGVSDVTILANILLFNLEQDFWYLAWIQM